MSETTTTAATETIADPMAAPMHAALQAALTPYLEGDLDPTTDLVEALLDVLAAAEPTSGLIGTLHQAVTGLVPTPELMGPLHHAVGAALNLTPVTGLVPRQTATFTTRSSTAASRPGSIADMISKVFAANPGVPHRVGDLVKALGDAVSGGGAVGAALNGMVARGEAALIGTSPKLYLSATDAELRANPPKQTTKTSAPATTDAAAPTASDTAPQPGADEAERTDTAHSADASADTNQESAVTADETDALTKQRPARRGKTA